ncbi:unnamed protein product [Closterium sp. NIES-53]
MYLMTCTRPDVAYPLSILARYVAPGRHRPEHMAAAKRVLRYLCSTSGLGLVLGERRPVVLTGHADASWADDQATQRSSQGYTFSLGSGSVSWRSTRSSSVLGSSCEAEIYAGAMAAQELRWLTYLLTDLGEQPRAPPQRGQLRLAYVASQANTADVFTKALPPGDHQRFCTMLACFALLDWSCDLLFSPTLPMGVSSGLHVAYQRFKMLDHFDAILQQQKRGEKFLVLGTPKYCHDDVLKDFLTTFDKYFDQGVGGDDAGEGEEMDNLEQHGPVAEDTGAPPVIDAEIVELGALVADGVRIGLRSLNVVGELEEEVQMAERKNTVVYQRREARTKKMYDQGGEACKEEEANHREEQKPEGGGEEREEVRNVECENEEMRLKEEEEWKMEEDRRVERKMEEKRQRDERERKMLESEEPEARKKEAREEERERKRLESEEREAREKEAREKEERERKRLDSEEREACEKEAREEERESKMLESEEREARKKEAREEEREGKRLESEDGKVVGVMIKLLGTGLAKKTIGGSSSQDKLVGERVKRVERYRVFKEAKGGCEEASDHIAAIRRVHTMPELMRRLTLVARNVATILSEQTVRFSDCMAEIRQFASQMQGRDLRYLQDYDDLTREYYVLKDSVVRERDELVQLRTALLTATAEARAAAADAGRVPATAVVGTLEEKFAGFFDTVVERLKESDSPEIPISAAQQVMERFAATPDSEANVEGEAGAGVVDLNLSGPDEYAKEVDRGERVAQEKRKEEYKKRVREEQAKEAERAERAAQEKRKAEDEKRVREEHAKEAERAERAAEEKCKADEEKRVHEEQAKEAEQAERAAQEKRKAEDKKSVREERAKEAERAERAAEEKRKKAEEDKRLREEQVKALKVAKEKRVGALKRQMELQAERERMQTQMEKLAKLEEAAKDEMERQQEELEAQKEKMEKERQQIAATDVEGVTGQEQGGDAILSMVPTVGILHVVPADPRQPLEIVDLAGDGESIDLTVQADLESQPHSKKPRRDQTAHNVNGEADSESVAES